MPAKSVQATASVSGPLGPLSSSQRPALTARKAGKRATKEGDGREHQSDFKRRSAVAQSVESHGETHARRTAVQYEQNEENFCQRRVHGNPPASARNVTDAQKSKNEVVTDA